MRHGVRRRVTVAAVAATVFGTSLLGGVDLADAHTVGFSTTPVIDDFGTWGVSGHIETPRTRCLRRTVVLWRQVAGPDQNLGHVRSSGDGTFAIEMDLPTGFYKVTARRKTFNDSDGHLHRCRRGTSEAVWLR
jgi:hypothetical protein